ncbi:MAG: octaprenyl-diphosphate synthase, partial [Baekduia sp.]|nr:octaprenyl-diphosphate synthase [Baekduia sp.]
MTGAGGPRAAGAAPATADGPVTAIVHAGGPHVLPLLDAVEVLLTAVAGGHGPVLAEHAGSTIAAGGKRLRPLLVILAAGGPVEPADGLVRAAAAVELVHSATLVHDDVLDLAPLRRGRPTVFAAAGRDAAKQTGDLLFSRAFALLAANGDAEQVRALSDAGSA